MSRHDIAIIGMGGRFPGSPNLASFWETIRAGSVHTTPVPRERWNHDVFWSANGAREANRTYAAKIAALDDVRSFAPEFFGLTPRRAKVMDPQQRLFLDSVRTALEDAGYAARPLPRDRMGVFVGMSVSDFKEIITARVRAWQIFDGAFGRGLTADEEAREAFLEDLVPMHAYTMVGSLGNMIAANVSQCFDFGGPSFTTDAACSSALVALHQAVGNLRAGLCDAAIVGGAYVVLAPDNMVAFARVGALSPTDTCRPYDGRADGFVMGEGIGAVVLRRLEDAQAAGDRIHAVIRGIAANSDGKSEGPMTPRREGQLAVLTRAYEDAGIDPHTLGFVEGHGTATPVGDATEIGAFRDLLGARPADCAIGSVKANIGHTLAAAGVAGLIKASLALRHRVIPPQANFAVPRPELEMERAGLYVPREARPWANPTDHPRRAGVNAFGFGGTNVHVVLEEAPESPRRRTSVAVAADFARPELIVLSAPTAPLLKRAAEELASSLGRLEPGVSLCDLAYTLSRRRADAFRLAIVASDLEDLRRQLGEAQGAEARPAEERKVAFLFPGQGLQSPGLCRDLYERFPAFRVELDRLAAAANLDEPLLSYLYPEHETPEAAAKLTATEVCQPAVAAVSLALARFAQGLGLAPDAVAGHSLGEFVAAAAAGLIAEDTACVRFLTERGRLIAELTAPDPGAMAAVAADGPKVRQLLAGIDGVVVANLNHPRQTVISGATSAISTAEAKLTAAGLKTTRLRVSHAFHSPLMAPAAAALKPFVAGLPLGAPSVPVISAIEPGPYPADVGRIFVAHATSQVDFGGALASCAAAGVKVYVQIGAGAALAGMVGASLQNVAALTLAGATPDGGASFLRALGQLFMLGVPLDLPALFAADAVQLVTMIPPSLLEERPLWPVASRDGARTTTLDTNMEAKKPESNGEPLAELFRQQMAVIDSHLAIIRQQNELLARGGAVTAPVELPAAPVARPVPSAESPRPEPAAPSQADLEAKVTQVVARITAHPTERLKSTTRLGADLGFDSLMVVELVSGLQELVPDAEPLARSVFAEDLSIADVSRLLRSSKAGARKVTPVAAKSDDIERYAVSYEPRPASGGGTVRGPVVIIGEVEGLAEALRVRLSQRRVQVRLATGAPDDLAAGATVIDLRGIGPTSTGLPDADSFAAPSLRAFELARRLDGARPAALLFAHRGLAAAGLAGFAKALGREWPETQVVAVDVEGPASADRLIAEVTSGETGVEVRHRGAERLVPVLRPAAPTTPGALPEGAVVAIAGGGFGLGARLGRELARKHKARLVLLGRRPAGSETEVLIGEIRAAGGDAVYVPCDVRDHAAVARALATGRLAFGPIQAAVHTAGIVQDAPIARKDRDGFLRVFDTKVAGALALWQALADDPLIAFLQYGSWAGRFGSAHQTDYSAANHLLGRLTEAFSVARPGVRVTTLDLPPWEGTAMLAGVPEAVRAEMRARGITFLTDETGLGRVAAELAGHGPSGEILLGAAVPQRTVPISRRTRLSSESHPYLDDHRIGDRPVLPLAVAADLLLQAARAAGAAPVDAIAQVQDLAVVKGVILADGAGEVVARASTDEVGGAIGTAEVELIALGARSSLAYRARIGHSAGWLEPVSVSIEARPTSLPLSEFYARHTFHGPRLRAVEEVTAVGAGQVAGVIRAGSDPALTWLLAVDGALQLCAYWAVVHHGRIGLPVGVGEMRLHRPIPAGARLVCRAALRRSDGDRFEGDLDLVDSAGNPVVQIRGLRAELVVGVESPVVDTASYRIEEFPEVKELRTKIDFAKAAGIDIPYFRTLDSCTGATALIDGREYLNFTSYNYVGLSGHPRIVTAVYEAVKKYGSSVSASRVTGGQKPLHIDLERELAQFLGTEASIVMVGGHSTNLSVIGQLMTPEDMVLHDSLAHDSILGGAKLAGAKRRPFPHNDVQGLERILKEVRSSVRRVLIAIEGVYSMDGDISPLPEIIAVKKKYGALLFVDEAHSLGVLGKTGRGVGEHYDVDRRDVDLWMGTMSKTLASCGGYIGGSSVLIEYLKYSVPGFIYSVGMTPANAAAALTALRILVEEPDRARTCQDRSRYFSRLLRDRGIDVGPSMETAVVPCLVGNSYACIRLGEALLRRGIHVHPIIYPAVAESLARLRFFVTAAHTEEQLRTTADAMADELANLKILPRRGEAGISRDAEARTGAS